jgi:hypothetical protein
MISPEFGEKLDLKEHTRAFMDQVEKDLGTKLTWVAVDHYNTDNPHVHLLIRGIDENGKALDIDSGYLKSGMRLRSKEIATNQLGHRTEDMAEYAREKQISSDRFTSLDKAILKRGNTINGNIIFNLEERIPKSDSARKYRIDLIRRLKKLESLGLAEKLNNNEWKLDHNFKENLQAIGKRSAALQILARHKKHMLNQNQDLAYTKLNTPGEKVIGKILGAGLDPDTDKPYLLLEGIDGKAHYVTQSSKIHAARLQSDLVDSHIAWIEVKSFNKQEDGLTKTIEYLEVKDYGSAITYELLDKQIISSIKNMENIVPVIEKGFAGEFNLKLKERIELYQQNEIVNEKSGYLNFSQKHQYISKYSTDKAVSILNKLITNEYVAEKLGKPIILQEPKNSYGCYIGTVEAFTYDKGKKYLVVDTGRELQAFPINNGQPTHSLKLTQKVTVEIRAIADQKTSIWKFTSPNKEITIDKQK